ncbi:MAG: hypothetical protein ACJ76S_03845 [Solirubrobacteraceae bacterium]
MLAGIDLQTDFFTTRAGTGHRTGFVLLAAFLLSFAFIRTSARMIRAQVRWWPGNVQTGSGLHIHHLVWGICLLMITGFLEFAVSPQTPWKEILAALFGVGAGLTLDEFALWLRLQDVYWSDQGRESLDAVVLAVLFALLVLVGLSPLDVDGAPSTAGLVLTATVDLLLVATCMLKGKVATGLVGMFVAPVALVGAIRLAKPGTAWAHRRYRDNPRKQAEAAARHAKRQALRDRLRNLLGGAPSPQ